MTMTNPDLSTLQIPKAELNKTTEILVQKPEKSDLKKAEQDLADLTSLEINYTEGVKRLVAQLTEMRQQEKNKDVVEKLEGELNDLQKRKSEAGRRIEDLLRNQIIPGRRQERGLA